MRAELCKVFVFDAAHQLPNHDGKCRSLHGHTYRVEVRVTGQVRASDGAPDEGMVIDFGQLSTIWKRFLEPRLDHKYLNESIEEAYHPTTAENIGRLIYDVFTRTLAETEAGTGCFVSSVTVWETPTGSARFPA